MARSVLLTSLAIVISAGASGQGRMVHPIYKNVGSICRWQSACMFKQQQSMRSALAYMSSSRPATWRVQVCNRNPSRGRSLMDWVGFNSCIRNKKLN